MVLVTHFLKKMSLLHAFPNGYFPIWHPEEMSQSHFHANRK